MPCPCAAWPLPLTVKSEVDSLQRAGEQRQAEIRQLQKQLSDTERDRHTEVVKLRLEVRCGNAVMTS